jgi:TRAP-type C4-dicarboxylate transport system substrate-binding protein
MQYNTERFAAVSEAYRKGLAKAMQEHPQDYLQGLTAEAVATRALHAVTTNGIRSVEVPRSQGWRNAAKTLGLKPTYKAFEAFLKGEA